jgi:hypothetical protein
MRVRIVLLALAAAVAACSSHQATHTAYQPTKSEAQQVMVPLVAEEAANAASSDHLSDSQIAEQMIDQSISQYPGNCPCPYSRARDRSRCGGRSAYSKAGGAEVICYREQVTAEMIQKFRSSLD